MRSNRTRTGFIYSALAATALFSLSSSARADDVVDQAKADTCMADKANAERINQVAKEATERYSINATPTLVINGVVQQPGNIPWTTLKHTLDSFLSKK